jgi:hypothetical protein
MSAAGWCLREFLPCLAFFRDARFLSAFRLPVIRHFAGTRRPVRPEARGSGAGERRPYPTDSINISTKGIHDVFDKAPRFSVPFFAPLCRAGALSEDEGFSFGFRSFLVSGGGVGGGACGPRRHPR